MFLWRNKKNDLRIIIKYSLTSRLGYDILTLTLHQEKTRILLCMNCKDFDLPAYHSSCIPAIFTLNIEPLYERQPRNINAHYYYEPVYDKTYSKTCVTN